MILVVLLLPSLTIHLGDVTERRLHVT